MQPVAGLLDDLAANEALLLAGLLGLSGLAHTIQCRPPASATEAAVPLCAPLESVEIKERGVTTRVALADVDWIGAQGNYLALHVGRATFLLRTPLAQFERQLDPTQFVRIHRSTIVAIDRVDAIDPAANGDGLVRLRDRQVLRVSRLYRKVLTDRRNA